MNTTDWLPWLATGIFVIMCFICWLSGYSAGINAHTPSEVPEADIEKIAHRKAWRYRHSTDKHHSHTYTFNKHTLIDFVRAVRQID